MQVEIKKGDRTAQIELLEKNGSTYAIKVDDNVYHLDVEKVEKNIYSILHEGRSLDFEVVKGHGTKHYNVAHRCLSFEIEIIDAESKYYTYRHQGDLEQLANIITSPMPGKIVKIPVKIGDMVNPGDTAIIISAMKMESEYKVNNAGIIKEILVGEGDTIEANQTLVVIE